MEFLNIFSNQTEIAPEEEVKRYPKVVNNVKIKSIDSLNYGMLRITSEDNLCGIMTTKSRLILPVEYENIELVLLDMQIHFIVKKNNLYSLIDLSQRVVVFPTNKEIRIINGKIVNQGSEAVVF